MALIAKTVLREGFLTVALPGNVVSPEMVARNGWEADVEDNGQGDIGGEQETPTIGKPRRVKKATAAE